MASRINQWSVRIPNANLYYKQWENRFKCRELEQRYEGFHWKVASGLDYKPYVLNLVYSTIKIKLANIVFQNPEFIIGPAPGHADWDIDFAARSAQLKEDSLNTQVKRQRDKFVGALKLAALDSFFRFGVIEVGYAADWRNPKKSPLITTAETNPENPKDIDQARIVEDPEVPENERIFWRHIPGQRFRTSQSDSPDLENCAWCGYYNFMYTRVLKKTKGIKFPKDIRSSLMASDLHRSDSHLKVTESGASGIEDLEIRAAIASGEVLKVWHIWNNETKKRLLILDEQHAGNFEVMFEDDFERLPFSTVRWDLRLKGWYPIPPVFQWLSPQDEVNEAREQLRHYRRRATRKFEYVPKKIGGTGLNAEVEIEKFTNELDGEMIAVKELGSIQPIQNPDLNLTMAESLQQGSSDFNIVSATSAQTRGESVKETATSTKVKEQAERIRENAEQIDFSQFVVSAGREGLLLMQERFSRGTWVRMNLDPQEQIFGEIQANRPLYQWVTEQQLDDGYDFTIEMNVTNATPAQMADEREKFILFLSLVSQFPSIALSPILIREAAHKSGYRNERVIQEMQRAAQVNLLGQIAQQGGDPSVAGGFNQNNANLSAVGNAAPNETEQVRQQLVGQLG